MFEHDGAGSQNLVMGPRLNLSIEAFAVMVVEAGPVELGCESAIVWILFSLNHKEFFPSVLSWYRVDGRAVMVPCLYRGSFFSFLLFRFARDEIVRKGLSSRMAKSSDVESWGREGQKQSAGRGPGE